MFRRPWLRRFLGVAPLLLGIPFLVWGLIAEFYLRGEMIAQKAFEVPHAAMLEIPVTAPGETHTIEVHTLRSEAIQWEVFDPGGDVIADRSEWLRDDGTRLWKFTPDSPGTHTLKIDSGTDRGGARSPTRVRVLLHDHRIFGRLKNLSF